MAWVRSPRGLIAIAFVALGIAISGTARNYLSVQNAETAEAFREAVGDDDGRVAAAALIDVAFAGSYALFAATFANRRRPATMAAAVLVACGAAADVVENLLVFRGASRLDDVSDGLVSAMSLSGIVKWAGIVSGSAVFAVSAWRRSRQNERTTTVS
jgi:hypothetical protein